MISFQKLGVADLTKLREIGWSTYWESFRSHNTEADMLAYMHTAFAGEKLQAELEDENSDFYFALYKNEVVGYLKLNVGDAQTEFREPEGIEIERIYVISEFQGKNIGSELLYHGIEIGNRLNFSYIWLGVWEKNIGALRFYERHGFTFFSSHTFILGEDVQTDLIMRKDL